MLSKMLLSALISSLLLIVGCDSLVLFEETTWLNVVCDAYVTPGDSTVIRYVSDPPGHEEFCWTAYGDSLAPATGGGDG
jgi:hypothetical protein